mgnify:CR=1 FL=1
MKNRISVYMALGDEEYWDALWAAGCDHDEVDAALERAIDQLDLFEEATDEE